MYVSEIKQWKIYPNKKEHRVDSNHLKKNVLILSTETCLKFKCNKKENKTF